MGLIVALVLLLILFGGLGFVSHLIWWLAVIVLAVLAWRLLSGVR